MSETPPTGEHSDERAGPAKPDRETPGRMRTRNALPKALLIALAVSLALNIFAGGVFIGGLLRGPKPFHGMRPDVDFSLRRMGAVLPEAERDALRARFRTERRKLADVFRERRRVQEKLHAVITAETVDPEALSALMAQYADLRGQLETPIRHIMADVIPRLDRETRIRLAGRLFFSAPHMGAFEGRRIRKWKGDRQEDTPNDGPAKDGETGSTEFQERSGP